jgi:hypothetical protein
MAPDPFNTDNTGLKGDLRDESVIVPSDVENDYVVAEKAGCRVALPNIMSSAPRRILRIRNPVSNPRTTVRMAIAVRM